MDDKIIATFCLCDDLLKAGICLRRDTSYPQSLTARA